MDRSLERLEQLTRVLTGEVPLHRDKPVMVGGLCEKVAAQIHPTARTLSIHFDLRASTDLPVAKADEELLALALWHMFDFEMRRAPTGTIVTVEMSHHFNREIRITFSDIGPTLSPELMPIIFDPFVADLDDQGHLTGLELPATRAIMRMHGGDAWAEEGFSGEGTMFVLSLPTGLEK